MPDVISIGECMVELFADESIATTNSFYKAYGGDTLNTLVAASRLGSSTGYVTRVGDDPFLNFLLGVWQKEGIDVSRVKTVAGQNGIYFISVTEGGQREFTYYRKGSAASTLCPEDIDHDYIAGSRLVHVSGITQALSTNCRDAVKKAVVMAKELGKAVSYDPNLRLKLWSLEDARDALTEILPYVDFFLPSEEDIATLLGSELSHDEVIEHFWRLGVPNVIIKCGDRGCKVGCNGSSTEVEPVVIGGVLDSTGAGDAFNGGFIHGMLTGLDPVAAARLGAIVAGFKLQARGAIAGLPFAPQAYARFRTSDS